MSIQNIVLVLEAAELCAQEKAVLTAFCNHTDPSGKTYAGEERLMRESGMPRTTFQRWRSELVRRGLLISKRKGRKGGGRATSDTWVNLEALRAARDPWFAKKAADRDEDDNPFTGQGVAEPSTRRSKSPVSGAKGGASNGPVSGAINGPVSGASPAPPVEPVTVNNPQSEPVASFGRDSVPDARRASTGSTVRATQGGSAASGKTKPATNQRTAEAIRTVTAALPAELRSLKTRPLPARIPAKPLGDLIRDQLAHHRTAEQLVARIERRWVTHGWAEKFHSTMDGEQLRSGVAIAMELLKAGECPDLGCEDGAILDTRGDCRTCEKRRSDRRAKAAVPAPATEPAAGAAVADRWVCTGRDGECQAAGSGRSPADGLCQDCRAELDEIRAAFSAAGFDMAPLTGAPF